MAEVSPKEHQGRRDVNHQLRACVRATASGIPRRRIIGKPSLSLSDCPETGCIYISDLYLLADRGNCEKSRVDRWKRRPLLGFREASTVKGQVWRDKWRVFCYKLG